MTGPLTLSQSGKGESEMTKLIWSITSPKLLNPGAYHASSYTGPNMTGLRFTVEKMPRARKFHGGTALRMKKFDSASAAMAYCQSIADEEAAR